jgi:hypothetical protein
VVQQARMTQRKTCPPSGLPSQDPFFNFALFVVPPVFTHRTLGIRVDPPTRTTSSTSDRDTPASCRRRREAAAALWVGVPGQNRTFRKGQTGVRVCHASEVQWRGGGGPKQER